MQNDCSKHGCDERGKHSHCMSCGFPIHWGHSLCGECICEEDAD